MAFRHGGILPYVVRQLVGEEVAQVQARRRPTRRCDLRICQSEAVKAQAASSGLRPVRHRAGRRLSRARVPARVAGPRLCRRDGVDGAHGGPPRATCARVLPRRAQRHRHRHALQHRPARIPSTCRAGVARISRYAWGDDYHDVLKPRLDALRGVDARGVAPSRSRRATYVDTGPVQERVYAQYAGLGWIGKNTCLINPELGLVAVPRRRSSPRLALEPDTQGLEQCGSCTRCLEACPTGALVEPGVLDSTPLPVVSDHRAARRRFPSRMRPALGAHVYGCDICQDVCPVQPAGAASRPIPHWQPRAGARRAAPRRAVAAARRRAAAAGEGQPDDARQARPGCAATSPSRSATQDAEAVPRSKRHRTAPR